MDPVARPTRHQRMSVDAQHMLALGESGRYEFKRDAEAVSPKVLAALAMSATASATPGHTFSTEGAACAWLRSEQTLIDRDEWTPPANRRAEEQATQAAEELTLDTFARTWMENRTTPRGSVLSPRRRATSTSATSQVACRRSLNGP